MKSTEFRVKGAHPEACQLCGLTYAKGSEDDLAFHRSYHAQIARVVDPRPLKRFADRLNGVADPELVTKVSDLWMHKEMHDRARAFRREFGYDSIQWADGIDHSHNPHGFLMRGTTGRGENCIVGACAFREFSPDEWTLTWAWVCPEARHTGVLSRRWQDFLWRFGDFHIDAPLSASMKQFILKQGTEAQKTIFGAYLTTTETED